MVHVKDKNETVLMMANTATVSLSHVDTITETFTASEQQRLARFNHDHRRVEFIVGHHLARMALAQLSTSDLNAWPIESPAEAAPYLSGNKQAYFNISHSQGMCVCVASLKQPVAVDIEHVSCKRNVTAIAENFFSTKEQVFIQAFAPEWQHHVFYQLWTLKESTIKLYNGGIFGGGLAETLFETPRRSLDYTVVHIADYACSVSMNQRSNSALKVIEWQVAEDKLLPRGLRQQSVASFQGLNRWLCKGIASQ